VSVLVLVLHDVSVVVSVEHVFGRKQRRRSRERRTTYVEDTVYIMLLECFIRRQARHVEVFIVYERERVVHTVHTQAKHRFDDGRMCIFNSLQQSNTRFPGFVDLVQLLDPQNLVFLETNRAG
jgi:hypothetical protein